MRQVMITRANSIPKKKKNKLNKYHAFVELLTKNMDKSYKNKEKKTKGIANADKKNLSRQFICPDHFFVQTNFLSGHFFCPDKRAITTK